MITGKYPNLRLRRSRKYAWSRKLVQESSLSYSDLILPIFLIEGKNKKESIKSMPNVFRYSVDKLNIAVGKAIKKGIPMVALFTYISITKKDANNSDKYLFFMTISLIYSFLIHFYILRVCKSTITLIFVKDQ